ncbi:MAG TPA: rhodanese-like domain-containing protein [Vicinamibacterales bacterium]|nr:rhodanese-like domain-containing protein [Vicinamibacterales bacterium]
MRTKTIAFVLSLVLISLAPAAAQSPREALVVSAAWLADHLKDSNLVLLHLGVKPEYDAGHIPGARFITLNEIAVSDTTSPAGLTLQMPAPDDLRAKLEAIGVSDNSRVVVSYGRDRIASATRVLYTLDYAGLGRQVSLLDGGVEAWVRDGRSLVTDMPAAVAGKLSPLRIQATIVDADFVKAQLEKPGVVVIDGRLPAFYTGAQTGGSPDRPHRTGHIAGAMNVPYTETLDAQQKLKPADALAQLFVAAGAKPGDTLVTYCHIGQQATAVAFAARTLGFKVLLYDGSFEDWSRRVELPVIKK